MFGIRTVDGGRERLERQCFYQEVETFISEPREPSITQSYQSRLDGHNSTVRTLQPLKSLRTDCCRSECLMGKAARLLDEVITSSDTHTSWMYDELSNLQSLNHDTYEA
jgi:hypothetical protein